MLGHVLSWLGSSLALWPALGVALLGVLWSLCVWASDPDDSDDGPFAIAVLGILGMIGALVGSVLSGVWAYWIPYLLGVAILPSILGVGALDKKYCRWLELKKQEVAARRIREQKEAERAKAEFERSPAGVIARCEAVVKRYIDALPTDLAVIEERRQAETKLDALRGLYKLLAAIEKLGADTEESFKQKLTEADALFSDVSLEGECGALVREIRERSVDEAPPTSRIHAAIEALVFSINSLPGKAAARIAAETPTEYRVASDDLTAEFGEPVLPVLDPSPESEERASGIPKPPRRQLA